MEEFRRTYLRVCKEANVQPQECIVAHLQGKGTMLDLSGLSLSVETSSMLARSFHKDTVITEVLLSDCMLSEECAKMFLTGLFSNTTVKSLDLKGNNLRAAGAEVLGKLLANNKSIQRLVLEWNALGIWDEGFSLFCEGLASNNTLTHLDLRNNQINHHGASELALALKRNTALEVLDLRWNNISLLGGRGLLEALQNNKSVLHLELAGNNIPSDMLRALNQSTGRNTDRQSSLRVSHNRTQVLSKEIHNLKQEKGRQFQSMMETIDKQREEMGRSSRSTSVQISQLQEALNERKSAVNSLTAKLHMIEAALALSEQKNHNMGEQLMRLKAEKEDQRERHCRDRKKDQEDSVAREGKLLREIQNITENNLQLKTQVEELERKCKSQQHEVFELKQELTNRTAELKLRLVQAEDSLEVEKRRSKQILEDMDSLRQKEIEQVTRHQEESERALQERIFKVEGQRIKLEEELNKALAACVTERAQAEEDLGRVRTQVRLEEQEKASSLEEKLRSLRSSLQEVQLHCSQQKHTISELQSKNSQHSMEADSLRRRIEELQQDLLGKDQEKVVEVSRVRVELQEQIGHMLAERTAQECLKEKVSALEREMKVMNSNHREVLRDKESEMSSLQERLRLRETEIQRMREDEAHRASYLQQAFLTYIQGSPLGSYGTPKK